MYSIHGTFEGNVKSMRQVPASGEKKPFTSITIEGDLKPGSQYANQLEYREYREPKCKQGDRVFVCGDVRADTFEYQGKTRPKLLMTFGQLVVIGGEAKPAAARPVAKPADPQGTLPVDEDSVPF
jgi:hypothetical protein